MSMHIDPKEAAHWSSIAEKLRQVSQLIGECRLTLMLELNVLEGPPSELIDNIESAINGGSYLFTPQTEWTGGDSSDPKNFKTRLPHIARR